MVTRKSWDEFRNSKLLWLANRTLHLFGWAICVVMNEDGRVKEAYPARVKFRGFDEKSESEGFAGLSEYVENNATVLREEAEL